MVELILLFSQGNGSNHGNHCLLLGINLLGRVNRETDGVVAEGNDLPGTGVRALSASLKSLCWQGRAWGKEPYQGLWIIVGMVIAPIKMKTLSITIK